MVPPHQYRPRISYNIDPEPILPNPETGLETDSFIFTLQETTLHIQQKETGETVEILPYSDMTELCLNTIRTKNNDTVYHYCRINTKYKIESKTVRTSWLWYEDEDENYPIFLEKFHLKLLEFPNTDRKYYEKSNFREFKNNTIISLTLWLLAFIFIFVKLHGSRDFLPFVFLSIFCLFALAFGILCEYPSEYKPDKLPYYYTVLIKNAKATKFRTNK